jgi:SAM-dependent methyltransferase
LSQSTSPTVLDIARKRHAGRTNIEFRHVDAERKLPSESVDFVLTVTVLNHIMDDASLRATMESLANALAPGGCFVALEGCVDANTAGRSTYQRNQTHDEWRAMFERCGLVAEDCFGFYHPTADRCRSFDRYAESLPVRLLRWMGPSGITTRALGAVAALYLLGRRDYLWRAKPTDALRLMIFRRPAVGKSNGAPPGVVATPDEPWLRHAHAPREPESTNEPCACVNYSLAMDFTTEHPIASAPALRIRPGG